MMELIGTLFTSVLGGGATGLLGMLLQRWFDHKKAQSDLELVKMQLQAAQQTRQMELDAQERMATKAANTQVLTAQLDAQAREIEAAERSYVASIEADGPKFSAPKGQEGNTGSAAAVRIIMAVVDAVRGLMRPGMTAYSLVLLTMVFFWTRDLYQRAGLQMSPAQVHELTMQCVGTVFYLAVTGYVWWFGVRPAQPQRKIP